MKKAILYFCFALLSTTVYANNSKKVNSNDVFTEKNYNPIDDLKIIACQNEYIVASYGCDGGATYLMMGSGTGDCGSAPQNSVVKHYTRVNVCDGEARDAFLGAAAAALAEALIKLL